MPLRLGDTKLHKVWIMSYIGTIMTGCVIADSLLFGEIGSASTS